MHALQQSPVQYHHRSLNPPEGIHLPFPGSNTSLVRVVRGFGRPPHLHADGAFLLLGELEVDFLFAGWGKALPQTLSGEGPAKDAAESVYGKCRKASIRRRAERIQHIDCEAVIPTCVTRIGTRIQ